MGYKPWRGWRFPLVDVACEMEDDCPQFRRWNRFHVRVHYSFDRDVAVYAWWPLAPVAWVAYWWTSRTLLRWSVERWMQRRIADKPEGEYYNFALLGCWRNWRRWTWKRTRAFPTKPPLGLRPAWLD